MARNTYDVGSAYRFEFWLVFSLDGSVRMARTEPSLHSSERAMFVSANLPKALWHTPTLKASIDVTADKEPEIRINLQAAAEQMRSALGFDVELNIVQPPVSGDE